MRDAILSAPVDKVLYQLTKPMVIGILAVFFFQLVDTYFISLLGTTSLAAVGFAMPVTMLVMNLSIGLGIAASAIIAKAFGAGEDLQAKRAAMAALMLVYSTAGITKALRDKEESERLHNRLEDARTERMLAEAVEDAPA